MSASPLLSLAISAGYPGKPGALRDVTLNVDAGEMVGLIGQSGSGKSTLSLAILRLLSYRQGVCRGSVLFEGRDLLRCSEKEMRSVRGARIGYVPQSPLASLNPAMSVGRHLQEAWNAHRSREPGWKQVSLRLMADVSLPPEEGFLRLRPRELSVGIAQRVLIALAILHNPVLLIADEPTSALDLITQSEILGLLRNLNRERGMAILHISHDLAAIAQSCDTVVILRDGAVVEAGPTQRIFTEAREEYTRRLIFALPRLVFAGSEAGEGVVR